MDDAPVEPAAPPASPTDPPLGPNLRPGIPWARLLAEGGVIILSILLALGADAWWDSRQDAERVEQHLRALARDFAQMEVGLDSSLTSANLAWEGGATVLAQLIPEEVADPVLATILEPVRAGLEADADPGADLWSAMYAIGDLELFAPSTAAYESLVASGDVELLGDQELKQALVNYYGYFNDLQSSEEQFLRSRDDLSRAEAFIGLPAWSLFLSAPLPLDDEARAAGEALILRLKGSEEMIHHLTLVATGAVAVAADYQTLRQQVQQIRDRLPEPR